MNDQTAKLLQALADKLGTTAQNLWKILLKQAPISSTVDLLIIGFALVGAWVLFKIHKKLLQKPENDNYDDTLYEKYGVGAIAPMMIATLCLTVFLICGILSLNTILSGYFNPDYWALNKILESLKN